MNSIVDIYVCVRIKMPKKEISQNIRSLKVIITIPKKTSTRPATNRTPRKLPQAAEEGPEGASVERDIAAVGDGVEAHAPEDGAADEPAGDGPRGGEDDGDAVAAVEQDGEGLDVVGDDGPAEGPGGRGHVVVPDDHEDGEQLGAAGDEEGGRDRVGPRVRREEAEERQRRGRRGREEADAHVEGQG